MNAFLQSFLFKLFFSHPSPLNKKKLQDVTLIFWQYRLLFPTISFPIMSNIGGNISIQLLWDHIFKFFQFGLSSFYYVFW